MTVKILGKNNITHGTPTCSNCPTEGGHFREFVVRFLFHQKFWRSAVQPYLSHQEVVSAK